MGKLHITTMTMITIFFAANATLNSAVGLTITLQPTAQEVCLGSTATFTIAATGQGTLTYQWRQGAALDLVDGGDISGATTATLQIANVDAADGPNYRCVVTDDVASVTSSKADLTLGAATAITQHPLPQILCAGETATFTVSATGSGTLTYQWQEYDLALEVGVDLVEGGSISGTTTTTLQILNVDPSHNGRYRCVVTGNCGSTASQSDALNVGVGTVPADRECDGDVDGSDFGIFASCFNGAGNPPRTIGCNVEDQLAFDFDSDNDIDGADFAKFASCFNGAGNPPLTLGCPQS